MLRPSREGCGGFAGLRWSLLQVLTEMALLDVFPACPCSTRLKIIAQRKLLPPLLLQALTLLAEDAGCLSDLVALAAQLRSAKSMHTIL